MKCQCSCLDASAIYELSNGRTSNGKLLKFVFAITNKASIWFNLDKFLEKLSIKNSCITL